MRATATARATPASCTSTPPIGPAVVAELIAKGKIHASATTVNAKSLLENCEGKFAEDRDVIKSYDAPMQAAAGFVNLKGNLFDSAIMKTSVISEEFRARYLSNADDPDAFEGRAIVFIIAGLLFTALFIGAVYTVVSLVLSTR